VVRLAVLLHAQVFYHVGGQRCLRQVIHHDEAAVGALDPVQILDQFVLAAAGNQRRQLESGLAKPLVRMDRFELGRRHVTTPHQGNHVEADVRRIGMMARSGDANNQSKCKQKGKK
jgi:hypothetical protein